MDNVCQWGLRKQNAAASLCYHQLLKSLKYFEWLKSDLVNLRREEESQIFWDKAFFFPTSLYKYTFNWLSECVSQLLAHLSAECEICGSVRESDTICRFCQTGAVTKITILSAVAVDVVAAIGGWRDVNPQSDVMKSGGGNKKGQGWQVARKTLALPQRCDFTLYINSDLWQWTCTLTIQRGACMLMQTNVTSHIQNCGKKTLLLRTNQATR